MLKLDLSAFKGYKAGKLITDGAEDLSFAQSNITATSHTSINLKPNGGFVIEFEGN